jgi:hypothetical protein
MLRAAAFVDPQGPERWGLERVDLREVSIPAAS